MGAIYGYAKPNIPSKSSDLNITPFSFVISAKFYLGNIKSPKYIVSELITPFNSPLPNWTTNSSFIGKNEWLSSCLYYLCLLHPSSTHLFESIHKFALPVSSTTLNVFPAYPIPISAVYYIFL